MLLLIAVTVPVEATGYYYLDDVVNRPKWLFPGYRIFASMLLGGYFANIPALSKYRNAILITIVPVIILNALYIFDREDFKSVGTYSFLLPALLATCWSIGYLYDLFKQNEIQDPAHDPNFWICAGLLFFYAGTFFQMGFTNIIFKENPALAKKLYVINYLLNCILYGMITYGFLCQSKYRK